MLLLSISEFFDKSNMPTEDDIHVKLKVCKGEEKLATPSDIVSGNFEEKEYYKIVEEDPTAGAGPNKWQEAILNWINSQSDSRYRPPTEYCGVNTPVFVKFDYPSDKDRINSNNFEIKVTPIAADAITRVELYIDNINVRNFEGQPYIYSATNVSNGVHTIKAVAKDSSGRQSEKIITIGINTDWNSSSTPTP